MRLIRDLGNIPAYAQGAVIALGNFDGVHLGHQAIFQHCVALAGAEKCSAAAMTFEPHPRQFFTPGHPPMHIHSFHCKAGLIAQQGVDTLIAARFNARLAATSAEAFVTDILHRKLKVRHVVTGYDFAFGKGRQGNVALLGRMAEALGFGFTAHPPVADGEGRAISSSAVRGLLKEGKMEQAAAMLGRPYCVAGHVRRGDRRGRKLGFPTANLSLAGLLPPRFGVYAARAMIESEGIWRAAAANLGIRPMYPAAEPLLETHIFDFQGDLYGRLMRVEIREFLREEKNFASEAELVRQMKKDCGRVRQLLLSSPACSGI